MFIYTFLYKILKFLILIISLFSLTLDDKYLIWLLMEMTSLIFISNLILSQNKEAGLTYFFISFISGSMIFIGLIFIEFNLMYFHLLFLGLIMKLSLYPFHSWFNFISKSMNYKNLYINMTYMKIIPLYLLYMTKMNNYIYFIVLLNLIIIPILMLNKNSLKLNLSFSSIYQTNLMAIIIYFDFNLFIIYFIVYIWVTMNLMDTLIYLKNLNNSNYLIILKKEKIFLFMNILAYCYFPPMTTFLFKWLMFENLILNNEFKYLILLLLIIISSVMMIWNYLNFLNYNFYNKNYLKHYNFTNNNLKSWNFYYLISFILMLMFLYSFFNY